MAFHCQKTSFMTNWRQQSTIQCVFPTLFCIRKGFILQARRNYTNILKLTQKLLPVAYKYIIWFWGSQVLPLPAQELTLCQQTTVSPLYVISWRAFRHAISLSARSLQTKHPNILPTAATGWHRGRGAQCGGTGTNNYMLYSFVVLRQWHWGFNDLHLGRDWAVQVTNPKSNSW